MTTSLIITFQKLAIKKKVQQRKLLAARYKIPCKSTKRRVQKLAARSAVKNGVK